MNHPPFSPAALLALFAGSAVSALAPQAIAQSTQPFPAEFQLSSLATGNGADGFAINGVDAGDLNGRSVSSAGDVNGDGIDDLIIGAYFADPNGNTRAGQSYVVFGGAAIGATGLIESAGLNGTNGFAINGIDAEDRSGHSVSSAGDVNGDGFADLIIGANYADPNGINAGESYVVFGGSGVGATGVVELSGLNGANGFVLNGVDANDQSGSSVSSAGDVNGDGIDDLIIGAPRADPNGYSSAGESYVVFGGSGVGATGVVELSGLNGTNGFVLIGAGSNNFGGHSVSSAGDVNGDGIDDLIIGAYLASWTGTPFSGVSHVVFGSSGVGSTGVLNLSTLNVTNNPNGFVLYADGLRDYSGHSVSSAGDVNGDGIDDLIIGADGASVTGGGIRVIEGQSHVVFGGPSLGSTGPVALPTLNAANGFVINGIDPGDRSGESVSSAGDVNGDGIDDLIIGAKKADQNGNIYAGESYVVFGGTVIGATGVLELSGLDGTNGFVLNGVAANDWSGRSVSSAGDVNDDGVDDVIIGAQRANVNGTGSGAGMSYVVFGRDLTPVVCQADTNGDGILDNGDIGFFVALFLAGDTAADFNADGILDNGDISTFVAAFLAGC